MIPLFLDAKCLVQAWSLCNFTCPASQTRTCIAHPSSHSPRWWCRINTSYATCSVCGSRHWTCFEQCCNPVIRSPRSMDPTHHNWQGLAFKPEVPGADAQRNYPQCWITESQLQNSNVNVEKLKDANDCWQSGQLSKNAELLPMLLDQSASQSERYTWRQ